jgi:hypothetical protein
MMKSNLNHERQPRVLFFKLASAGLIGSFLAVSSATSHAAPGSLAGLGNYACSAFSQIIKQDPAKEDDFFNWLEGYISGSNIMLQLDKKPLRDASSFNPAQHRQFVRGWCNLHPTDQFVIAAYQLFIALSFMPQQ